VHEQIARNKRKTFLLLGLAILFTALIGYVIGYLWFSGPYGVVIAVILAIVLSLGSYFYGDRAVLASTHARAVTPQQEPRLHNVVEGLAIAAGIPKPKVYVVPEAAPNAFATGRDPQHSSIAVTQGLLDIMNRVELEGVIGHEMSHILDRDILIGTVVATVVGAAVLMSQIFMRSWIWGGGGGRGRRDSSGGDTAGALALILFVVGIVLLIIAPLAGQLIKLSVSRNREYLADAEGVALTRYPPGLISALQKISTAPHAMRAANNATAHLWLDQPSQVPGQDTSSMEKLFSTHPPIAERIKRLQEM
jgi:heat shock protein HtpX